MQTRHWYLVTWETVAPGAEGLRIEAAPEARGNPPIYAGTPVSGEARSPEPTIDPGYPLERTTSRKSRLFTRLAPMSGGDWCSADIRAEARNKLGGSPTRRSCSQPAPGCSAPRSKSNPRPPLQAACACCPPWGFAKSPYPGVDRTLRNPDRESRRSDTIGALPDPARVAASGPDDREPGSILMASTWPCRTPYRVCIEAHAQ